MSVKKFLTGLGLLLALVFVGAVVYLSIADLGSFKTDIQQAVSDATGRDFHINGDFHVRLLPSPNLVVENATFSNASWGAVPDMLDVGHFSARIGLWSLLFPPVVIRDIRLRDVKLLLEVNGQGDGNWNIRGSEPETPESTETSAEPFRLPVEVRFAEISNVDIEYRAADSEGARLELASLGIQTNEAGRHVIKAGGTWSGRPFTIDGTVGNGKAELDFALDRVELRSVSEYFNRSVEFSATIDTMGEIGKLLQIENLPQGQLSLDGSATLQGDSVHLSNVLAELGPNRINLEGDIDVGNNRVELSIGARGPSLRELHPELPEVPFTLQADVMRTADGLSIEPFEAVLGASELGGSVKLPQGTPTIIIVRANAPLIDLEPFLSDEAGEAGGSLSEVPNAQPSDAYVFTTKPLPIALLKQLSADVEFTVQRLKTSTDELQDLQVVARAGEGALDLEGQFRGTKGGDYRGQATLVVAGDGVDLTVSGKTENLRLGLLSGPEIADESIPATSVSVDITASGGTARALAASSNGRILITSGPGLVKNELMEKVSGDVFAKLFEALNPLATQEEFSDWQCTVFSLDFVDGLGEVGGFLMQSDKLMIVGRGEIDLNTEKLNLEFNTKPREGIGLSADMFVTPFVKLSGTLANPAVGLNKSGALVSGGAAVLTGGMSFLFQGVMDRATAREDKCAQAFEAVGVGPG